MTHSSTNLDRLIDFALETDSKLLGPDQAEWLDRLDDERKALQLALDECLESADAERACRLFAALTSFWWMRGHTRTGLAYLTKIDRLPIPTVEARVDLHRGAASLLYSTGEFDGSLRRYSQALHSLGNGATERDRSRILDRAGMAARQLMRLDEAEQYHTEALDMLRRTDDQAGLGLCLNNLGVVAFFRGELTTARQLHEEALSIRKQVEDARGEASSLNNLGQVARFADDLDSSVAYLQEGLAIRETLGDTWGIAGSHVNLAATLALLGDTESARGHLERAVQGFESVGDKLGLCECLEAEAELALAEGRLEDARSLIETATRRRNELPAPRAPVLENRLRALGLL